MDGGEVDFLIDSEDLQDPESEVLPVRMLRGGNSWKLRAGKRGPGGGTIWKLRAGKRGLDNPLWKLRAGKRMDEADKRTRNSLWKLRGGKRGDDFYNKREALWKLRAGKRASTFWKLRSGKRSPF